MFLSGVLFALRDRCSKIIREEDVIEG